MAELNLIAGQRAKASTAYASALTYLVAGAALLPDDCWERRHELAFALELHRAECEFLTGELADAEDRLSALATRARECHRARRGRAPAASTCTRPCSQPDRAVEVGLDYLRRFGVHWSAHPTDEDVRREYEQVWAQLGSRPIEALFDLPLMSDPLALATMDVLTAFMPAALFTDGNLRVLVVARGREAEPRVGQQRRLVRPLRHVRRHRRHALRRPSGRIAIQQSRHGTGRTARPAARPGKDLPELQ